MPLEIGQNMGPYRVIEALGQGGMATVYKAYHASLDRYVAIKVLHPALKDDDTFSLRFQREAQIVAKLEHPNIVPVFDFATDVADPYIVMKFIEGHTLKHVLKRKHLTLEETLQFLPPIASALAYAHRRGVLHRDVKPSNVMIDETDNTPYLADFGLARIASSGESTMSQDVLIGTPNYISPEQAKGDKNLTPATDIYSLGILLYEIVVGRVPFSGDTPYAVVHDHIYKPLPVPSHVNPTVPLAVERVLLKSLSKEPADRYQTAVDLMEAFQEAVQESDLKELSAASVQLERFQDSTAVTTSPTASRDDLNEMVREAVTKALATQAISSNTPTPAPREVAIPPVIPEYSVPISSSVSRRRRGGSKRAFWVLSGLAALIFICIASLGVFINALQNPIVQGNPALVDAEEIGLPLVAPPNNDLSLSLFENINLSIPEAQALVEENPDDPSATLALSFLYLERGEQDLAQEYLLQTVQNPQVSGTMIAEAARYTAARGFNDDAVVLWGLAYELEPDNPIIRNDAGEYLYRQMPDLQRGDLSDVASVNVLPMDELFSTGLSRVMMAHTILEIERFEVDRLEEQVPTLLDYAIQQGDARPEAYLIYGDYYLKKGDEEQARESWEFANSFLDTPQWVERELETRLSRLNE